MSAPPATTADGRTAYGKVPDPIAMPLSTYQQAAQAMPGLPGLTKSAGDVVQSQLSGEVSPGTADYLQQLSAQWGVGAGMPGMGAGSVGASGLVRSLGLTSEDLANKGVGNFNNLLGTVAGTQLSPETQANVNMYNTQLAAAPDPALAAQQQIASMKDLYSWEQNQQLQGTKDLYNLQSQFAGPGSTGAKNNFYQAYGAQGQNFDLTTPEGNKAYAMYNMQGI